MIMIEVDTYGGRTKYVNSNYVTMINVCERSELIEKGNGYRLMYDVVLFMHNDDQVTVITYSKEDNAIKAMDEIAKSMHEDGKEF